MHQDIDAALHALWEANRLLRDEGEQIAARIGQTHARRMVLQSATSGATVPDIAGQLGLQRQSVQRVADRLVKEGLARYQDNPRHRRSKLLVLTEAGTRVRAEIAASHHQWLGELTDRTPDLRWDQMRKDLESLVKVLNEHAEIPAHHGHHPGA